MKKSEYNRIYHLIVFDEKDNIICTMDFCNFDMFSCTIDNFIGDGYLDFYEYKEEFIDLQEGALYISLRKKY